jgi:signal transduction histidine kinase
VYVDIVEDPEKKTATCTIKNISSRPLNISPEELTERFVRGDVSRTTEGSGLGLSIAKSLTKLMDGDFIISIDGDLYKASVVLKAAVKEANDKS